MEMVVCNSYYFYYSRCAATSTQVECIVLNWGKKWVRFYRRYLTYLFYTRKWLGLTSKTYAWKNSVFKCVRVGVPRADGVVFQN